MNLYFLRLGIEHRHLTRRSDRSGTPWRTGCSEPFLHQAGLSMPRTVAASQTRPLLVEHGVVVVGAWCPRGSRRPNRPKAAVGLIAPAWPGPSDTGMLRIGHRHLEERHLVGLRIEDRHVVGRIFRRAVERAVGIDRRIAPVRRDQVVQVLVRRRPVPGGDDEIALDAGRPLRLVLRQFALGDAVGPVAEILVRRAAELAGDAVGHHLAGLAGLDAANPGVRAEVELAELRRDRARRFLAELMTADAVGVVHLPDPGFARDVLRNVGRCRRSPWPAESSSSCTSRSPDSSAPRRLASARPPPCG